MSDTANYERLQEVADLVAERVRLKKRGEVLRYTRTVLEVLRELGYRVDPQIVWGTEGQASAPSGAAAKIT